jgi:hypothetical protein
MRELKIAEEKVAYSSYCRPVAIVGLLPLSITDKCVVG